VLLLLLWLGPICWIHDQNLPCARLVLFKQPQVAQGGRGQLAYVSGGLQLMAWQGTSHLLVIAFVLLLQQQVLAQKLLIP
jgi:hypothetical protein